ncbi:hypothetical protein GLOTRDRAFT_138236 [Gloeophyllum trabeum ATCC 11539]|uniref:SUZ domain-containing protein n=1 Tax=Gloeophyllum trabeum (strain ATCC 11539 / FP-39264 / Madison 617) TaxID=670483 RepID=S7RTR0_GLOTA|nr:uncharacterized protein GLOTRDRAFT_138236 [Gloeophyllum trabeum ATCC 11539]EPQ56529.1 hypothetical protein GLOTRDRAFT_138236 [Gloeophyllum trabeum ATCC 11539]
MSLETPALFAAPSPLSPIGKSSPDCAPATAAARSRSPLQPTQTNQDMALSTSPSPIQEGSESITSADSPSNAPSSAENEPEGTRSDDGAQKEAKQEVDPSIVEALRSKDRLFVLRLGEQMETLFTEQKTQIDVLPTTSYQRLLVHRCAAYYKLRPENDPASKGLIVMRTVESKIPTRRLADLVPAELPSAPAFKIMRRVSKDRSRSKAYSQAGSTAGDEAELSDVEPSESGSIGGRSNATGHSKKHMTIEEREAAYKEARSRIFMDFEEKEKDMSGSSSTRSIISGSGGEGSSIGDIDDSNSTAPTESEWSAPVSSEKREGRRGKGSSRSLRSSARGSRAASPSFTYASLYEPPVPGASYDPSQMGVPPPQGYMQHYMYPYPPPGQAPGQGYLAPYPYYPPYSYQHQPYPMTHSEPVSPSGGEMYGPIPPPLGYNPYAWAPPQQQPPPPGSAQGPLSQQSQQSPNQPAAQPMQAIPQYPPPNAPMYAPPYGPASHMYGQYPVPPYYPPHSAPPPHMAQPIPTSPQMQPHLMYHHPMDMSGPNGPGSPARNNVNGNSSGNCSANHSRTSSRNSSNNGGRRGAPQARHAWTYGPGIGSYTGNESVGPRLTPSMRRQTTTSSVGSASTGNRTPGDETSSVASSSTSSSSRRTYTSTSTTSTHPLPARPDWAVGLRPQSNRHLDNNTPSRNGSNQQQSRPVPPQSNDFPPLTLSPPPKAPATTGAWINASSTRSILMPSAPQGGQPSTYASALVQHPASNGNTNQSPRLDSQAFERPPPKGPAELFNPKGRRPTVNNGNGGGKSASPPVQDKVEKSRGDAAATAALADKMGAVTLDGKGEARGTGPGTAHSTDSAAPADSQRPDGVVNSS